MWKIFSSAYNSDNVSAKGIACLNWRGMFRTIQHCNSWNKEEQWVTLKLLGFLLESFHNCTIYSILSWYVYDASHSYDKVKGITQLANNTLEQDFRAVLKFYILLNGKNLSPNSFLSQVMQIFEHQEHVSVTSRAVFVSYKNWFTSQRLKENFRL